MRTLALVLILAGFGCVASDGESGTNGADGTDGNDGSDGADGSNGSDGNDGKPALLRLDDEDPGTQCANGGTAIHSGVDDNGDGVLQDAEIDNTAYLCDAPDGRPTGTVQGSVTIRSSIDSYFLANVTEITGALTVDAPGLTTLSLPNLQRVGGTLDLKVPDLTTLDLSDLTSVGTLRIDAPVLDSLATMSSLTTITLGLRIFNCPALHSLAGLEGVRTVGYVQIQTTGLTSLAPLNGVTTVTGDVTIQGNAALTTVGAFNAPTAMRGIVLVNNAELTTLSAFAEVVSANGLYVTGSSKLASWSIPRLETLSYFTLYNAAGVQSVELPALETIAQNFSIFQNATLTTLSAPQLTSIGSVDIESNASLTSIDFASLTTITSTNGAYVIGNPMLCNAEAIRDNLVGYTAPFYVGNNSSSCP